MHGVTIGVDPGKHHVGLAVFHGDVLVHARTLWVEEDWPANTPALTHAVSQYLTTLQAIPAERVAFEFPKIRIARGKVQEKNPNVLRHLCYTCGIVNAIARPKVLKEYEPSDWKGTISGDQKIEQIKRKLTPEENVSLQRLAFASTGSKWELDHNTWDAIGIGLRYLNRMHR